MTATTSKRGHIRDESVKRRIVKLFEKNIPAGRPRVPAADENSYDIYEVPSQLLVILAAAALVGMFAAVIVIRRFRLRRRKLRAFDPCQRCGFDLRATSGPCPKCGKARPDPPPQPKSQKHLFDDFEDKPWHVS